jgi:hypothetical protein
MNTSDIQKLKLQLGSIQILDYRHLSIVEAHGKLGEEVGAQARKLLKAKILDLDNVALSEEIKFAKDILQNLQEKSKSPKIDNLIRGWIKTYLLCLNSWANGAQLERVIEKSKLGAPVLPEALTLFLQNDNTGCQTGVLRKENGSVLLWHTEEDDTTTFGERFDKLRLAVFHLDTGSRSVDIFSFIYPDLLPGAAFNWRSDGYMQAVDALYLVPDKNAFTLANSICWLTLFAGQDAKAQAIFDGLKPVSDGYVLNVVFNRNKLPHAERIEFARDQYAMSILAEHPNSFHFQVNLFSDFVPDALKQFEDISDDEKSEYLNRRKRTAIYIKTMPPSDGIRGFHELLSSQEGTPYCYASPWVKSYILANLKTDRLEIWMGSGPALQNDVLQQFFYEF